MNRKHPTFYTCLPSTLMLGIRKGIRLKLTLITQSNRHRLLINKIFIQFVGINFEPVTFKL